MLGLASLIRVTDTVFLL